MNYDESGENRERLLSGPEMLGQERLYSVYAGVNNLVAGANVIIDSEEGHRASVRTSAANVAAANVIPLSARPETTPQIPSQPESVNLEPNLNNVAYLDQKAKMFAQPAAERPEELNAQKAA